MTFSKVNETQSQPKQQEQIKFHRVSSIMCKS